MTNTSGKVSRALSGYTIPSGYGDVFKLQQDLNRNGAGLVVDGIYGPKTDAAFKQYGSKLSNVTPAGGTPGQGSFTTLPGTPGQGSFTTLPGTPGQGSFTTLPGTPGQGATGTGTAGAAGKGTGTVIGKGTGTGTAGAAGTGTGTAGAAGTGTGTAGAAGTGTGTAGAAGTGTSTVKPAAPSTDYAAMILKGMEAGASAEEIQNLLNQRNTKIMNDPTLAKYAFDDIYKQASEYVKKNTKETPAGQAEAQVNTTTGAILNDTVADDTMTADDLLATWKNIVGGDYSPYKIPETLSWEQALSQSQQQLDPVYNEQKRKLTDDLQLGGVRSGFIGQVPWQMFEAENQAMLENQRSGQIAGLANDLVGQSRSESQRMMENERARKQDLFGMFTNALGNVQGSKAQKADVAMKLWQAINDQNSKDAYLEMDKGRFAMDQGRYGMDQQTHAQNMRKSDQDYAMSEAERQTYITITQPHLKAVFDTYLTYDVPTAAAKLEETLQNLAIQKQYGMPTAEVEYQKALNDLAVAKLDEQMKRMDFNNYSEQLQLKMAQLREEIANAKSEAERSSYIDQLEIMLKEQGVVKNTLEIQGTTDSLKQGKVYKGYEKQLWDLLKEANSLGQPKYDVDTLTAWINELPDLTDPEKRALMGQLLLQMTQVTK